MTSVCERENHTQLEETAHPATEKSCIVIAKVKVELHMPTPSPIAL